jgi:hypothetical protein
MSALPPKAAFGDCAHNVTQAGDTVTTPIEQVQALANGKAEVSGL